MINNISIIVAIDSNYGIGKNNDLLCRLPSDLIRFKKITSGHTIIMGENTYKSLPKFPLPNRKNVIISFNDIKVDNAIILHSIDDTLDFIEKENNEVFIIGGASIYRQFLPYANTLYLTKIKQSFDADVFFPEIGNEWNIVEKNEFEDNNIKYDFLILKK